MNIKHKTNIKEFLTEHFFHKYDNRTPFKKIIGYCDSCPYHKHKYCLFKYPKTVRLNTMYSNEKNNYFTGCDIGIEGIIEYYDELWDATYSNFKLK